MFLPSAGEPLALLDNTLRYASELRWGGALTVYVLDDSARLEVRELAERYGLQYVVRPNPGELKKAGNLTHALSISDGEFIAVIDADFAVRPEFLYETMPYFAEPTVGIVQTAQFFEVGRTARPTSSGTRAPCRRSSSATSSPPGTATRPRSARAPTWSTGVRRWSPRAVSRRSRSVRTCTRA